MNIAKLLRRPTSADATPAGPGDPLDAYLSHGVGQVQGWLSSDAIVPIKALGRHQTARGVIGGVAEIGIHHAQLFILLCLLTADGERAVGYDLFERQDENIDGSGRGSRDKAEANLARMGVDPARSALVTANSLDLTPGDVRAAAGGPVRLFSVDGGHTPEITASDLAVAVGALAEQGIVILDDVFSQMWPGVGEGLARFMADHEGELVPFGLVGNKTLLCRPASHDGYLAVLDDLAPQFWTRRDRYYGADVRILLDPA